MKSRLRDGAGRAPVMNQRSRPGRVSLSLDSVLRQSAQGQRRFARPVRDAVVDLPPAARRSMASSVGSRRRSTACGRRGHLAAGCSAVEAHREGVAQDLRVQPTHPRRLGLGGMDLEQIQDALEARSARCGLVRLRPRGRHRSRHEKPSSSPGFPDDPVRRSGGTRP